VTIAVALHRAFDFFQQAAGGWGRFNIKSWFA
jgi:hypothetical protein